MMDAMTGGNTVMWGSRAESHLTQGSQRMYLGIGEAPLCSVMQWGGGRVVYSEKIHGLE